MISLSDYIYESMEEELYVLYKEGGSISDAKWCNAKIGSKHVQVCKMNLTKELATERKKSWNKSLSPGEKKYYGIKYNIAPESKVKWDSEEQREEVMKKSEA